MQIGNITKKCCATAENRFNILKYLSISLLVVLVSGCYNNAGTKGQSTISVSGVGTVSMKPDMVQMTIGLSKTASTTKLAQEETGRMVRQALDVLAEFGVEDKNIITTSLIFSPEYEYRQSKRVLIGQTVRQAITFSVTDIQNNNQRASQIIDRLVLINGIELDQTSFKVSNNTEYFIMSRELAFQKAAEKAKQYAELSGYKVGKVLSISEEGNQSFFPSNRMLAQSAVVEEMAADAGSGALPSGEIEITTKVLVEFLLK